MTLKPTLLPNRGIIKISGDDRATFLQGLITNDVKKLETQPVIYACLLTPQGKFLFDFFIYNKGEFLLLECQSDRIQELIKKLSLYKLRSKVALEDVSENYQVVVGGVIEARESEFVQDPRLQDLGMRALISGFSEFTRGDLSLYTLNSIALGVPDGSLDLIPDKSILLENGLDELHAIDWKKGCYIGQELTSRTKYTGIVRKRLFPVEIEGDLPPFGETLYWGDDKAGEMRSSQNNRGLALIRLEALLQFQKTGAPFLCAGAQLKPYIPDWMEIALPVESTKSENPPGKS